MIAEPPVRRLLLCDGILQPLASMEEKVLTRFQHDGQGQTPYPLWRSGVGIFPFNPGHGRMGIEKVHPYVMNVQEVPPCQKN